MNVLIDSMQSVNESMQSVIKLTQESLSKIQSINKNAQEGDRSMKVMQESMQKLVRVQVRFKESLELSMIYLTELIYYLSMLLSKRRGRAMQAWASR